MNIEKEIHEYQSYIQEKSNDLDVVPDIHPQDFIFRFVWGHPGFETKEGAIDYYLSDGERSARKLADLIKNVCDKDPLQVNVLEFASGYGCVTRHFHKFFDSARVTSSDIHSEAMKFCATSFGVNVIQSTHTPEALDITQQFDIVFALSFFSHMPDKTWGKWLEKLFSFVKVGGQLIFTTHGVKSLPHLGNPLVKNGFWFKADSEQKDLDKNEYGLTISLPNYVIGKLFECDDSVLQDYKEAYWWEHQDNYVIRKEHNVCLKRVPVAQPVETRRIFKRLFSNNLII